MAAGWLKKHIATAGLKTMIEGAFGELVELTPPDGIDIVTNEDGQPLRGQVIRDFQAIDPDTGDTVVVTQTLVSLRKTALRVIPEPGQRWGVRIQTSPSDETLIQLTINTDESIMGGSTAGFVTLALKQFEVGPGFYAYEEMQTTDGVGLTTTDGSQILAKVKK